MKIQVLGTAAAECWPGVFCNDDFCQRIRKIKGKNIRSRAQLLIDKEHLIDFGYDNFYHSVKFDVDFSQIRDIFITHSHDDHYMPHELKLADQGVLAYNTKYSPIQLYGDEKVVEMGRPFVKGGGVELNVLHPFDKVTTPDGYTFYALRAEHDDEGEDMLNYIVEHKGKTFIYLCDTGFYRKEDTWEFISQFKFDCVINECTFVMQDWESVGHSAYKTGVLKVREKLQNMNCINENTSIYITHFTHMFHDLDHDTLCEMCRKDNVNVCYDGMEIEI